ncbi:Protein of unknown function, partial [Gryllus bimaculatus]
MFGFPSLRTTLLTSLSSVCQYDFCERVPTLRDRPTSAYRADLQQPEGTHLDARVAGVDDVDGARGVHSHRHGLQEVVLARPAPAFSCGHIRKERGPGGALVTGIAVSCRPASSSSLADARGHRDDGAGRHRWRAFSHPPSRSPRTWRDAGLTATVLVADNRPSAASSVFDADRQAVFF